MGTRREAGDAEGSAGPTLYLDSDDPDVAGTVCTAMFEETDHDYRIVQLTSTQSFESVRDALGARLERINDPSEAAVIVVTPQDDEKSASAEIGEDTPLYGFRVDPQDLTGISVAFSRLIGNWEDVDGTVRICLQDIESLLPYHDDDLVYRFLNTVLSTLQGAGAEVHTHLQPAAMDDRTLHLLESLHDRVIDRRDDDTDGSSARESPITEDRTPTFEPGTSQAGETDATSAAGEEEETAMMSADEVDAALSSAGHGILALDGSPPYAIPMSYGYDPNDRVVYLHLAMNEGSEKRSRLAASDAASLVVSRYERPDRWWSVVVDGTLSRLSEATIRNEHVAKTFAGSDLASIDVFVRDPSSLTFEWYALEPSTISGRQGAGSR